MTVATCLLAGFAEPIFSTLKMEAICSSETSVETRRTTRRHIPEDDTRDKKFVLSFVIYLLIGTKMKFVVQL
jgi:hypothetical protein